MKYRDNGFDPARRPLQKNAQGVRGSVAYRKLSDSYASEKNCPRALLIFVNTTLILLSLSLLSLLLLFFTPLGDMLAFGFEKVTVSYTLELYDVDGTLSSAPVVGTSLIDPATGEVLGEITAVSTRPCELSGVLWQEEWESLPSDAEAGEITLPVRVVSVTVKARARYREDRGYLVGDLALREGGVCTVSLGGTVSSATCIAVERRA